MAKKLAYLLDAVEDGMDPELVAYYNMNRAMPEPGPAPVPRAKPLLAGFHAGLLGAAGGLSVAAIQRMLRLRQGDMTPPAVAKPMLIGGTIGAVLGTALASGINLSRDKYGSVKQAAIPAALFRGLRAAVPWLTRAGMVVGAVPAAQQAWAQGREAVQAPTAGEKVRYGLNALANAVFAGAGVATLGRAAHGIADISRASRLKTLILPERDLTVLGNLKQLLGKPVKPTVTPYRRSLARFQNVLARRGLGFSEAGEQRLDDIGRWLTRIGRPLESPLAFGAAMSVPVLAPLPQPRVPVVQHLQQQLTPQTMSGMALDAYANVNPSFNYLRSQQYS